MAGIIFSKKYKSAKILHLFATVFTAIFACVFLYKRLSINYANIYPTERFTGIEYSVLYSTLFIGFSVALLFLISCFLLKSNQKSK